MLLLVVRVGNKQFNRIYFNSSNNFVNLQRLSTWLGSHRKSKASDGFKPKLKSGHGHPVQGPSKPFSLDTYVIMTEIPGVSTERAE